MFENNSKALPTIFENKMFKYELSIAENIRKNCQIEPHQHQIKSPLFLSIICRYNQDPSFNSSLKLLKIINQILFSYLMFGEDNSLSIEVALALGNLHICSYKNNKIHVL